MREILLAFVMLSAGLAGCIGGDEISPASTPPTAASTNTSLTLGDPVSPITECTIHCKEPTVAVDSEGRIFVAEHLAENRSGPAPLSADGMGLVRSTDGGATFETLGAPPMPDPAPPRSKQGDSLVQIGPDGSLYFSTLVHERQTATIYGVQVARSDDGGDTWASNTFVSPLRDPGSGMIEPDRQWLGFGPNGTVHLVYTEPGTGTVAGHRSPDRGETWSSASIVVTGAERARAEPAGSPAVGDGGTIYVPFLASNPSAPPTASIRVAISTDGGGTWTTSEALRAPFFSYIPMLTLDRQGHLHAVARSGETLLMGTSADGGETWSDPVTWTDDDLAKAPWIDAANDNLTVAYYESDGNGSVSLELAQRPLDAEPGSGPTQRVTVAEGLPSAHTDFAHFAEGPGGPWVTWGDADAEEVRLVGPAEGLP